MLPLQWPLVGRHEELEPVLGAPSPTLVRTVSSSTARRVWARPGWRTNASRSPIARDATSPGRRRPKERVETPLGALAHLLPPGIADDAATSSPSCPQSAQCVRDQANDGPLVLFVDDLHLLDATSATLVAPARRRRSRLPGGNGPHARAGAAGTRVAVAPRARASHRPRRPRPRRGRHAPPPRARRTGRGDARSPNLDGQPRQRAVRPRARARSARQRSPRSTSAACGASPVRSSRRPRLHELVAARLASLDADAREALDTSRSGSRPAWPCSRRSSGETQLEALDRCGPAHRANRRTPPTGDARAPAVRRDPPGRDAGAHAAPPAARARRPHRRPRRSATRGRDPCGDRAARGDGDG